MQAVLGSLLAAGYALAMSNAIASSGDAQQITEQTQATLQLSYVSAAAVAEQYPQYASQIVSAARESFLSGANWAYGAAIAASLIGAVLVWTRYPGKQGRSISSTSMPSRMQRRTPRVDRRQSPTGVNN